MQLAATDFLSLQKNSKCIRAQRTRGSTDQLGVALPAPPRCQSLTIEASTSGAPTAVPAALVWGLNEGRLGGQGQDLLRVAGTWEVLCESAPNENVCFQLPAVTQRALIWVPYLSQMSGLETWPQWLNLTTEPNSSFLEGPGHLCPVLGRVC